VGSVRLKAANTCKKNIFYSSNSLAYFCRGNIKYKYLNLYVPWDMLYASLVSGLRQFEVYDQAAPKNCCSHYTLKVVKMEMKK